MRFDLLIKGGEVVDPGGGRSGRLDVAIKRNRIAAVDADIPAETAFRVVDAGGQYVTPGLVDLHTHVNYGCGFYGIRPDPIAARSGVTTWLDVGSSGGYNFLGFREFVIENSQARIYALLNISSIGLTAKTWELANPGYCDADLCCQIIDLNRDVLLGVKARIDQLTTSGQGLAPLHKAREAADRCELPLMTHIGMGPPGIDDVMELMRPGDILTHCFTGGTMRIVEESGDLRETVKRAWDAGLVLDIGHGAGSFSFTTAEALMSQGYRPDVISSDIHQMSVSGPMFDMPTCLSKFMSLGMSFFRGGPRGHGTAGGRVGAGEGDRDAAAGRAGGRGAVRDRRGGFHVLRCFHEPALRTATGPQHADDHQWPRDGRSSRMTR